MKTSTLVATACFIVTVMLFSVGAYKAILTTDKINHFGENSKIGSSGGGYPTYDESWMYIEFGSIPLAAGIFAMFWRKRK